MKQKKSFFLTLALLVILIIAAVTAYNKLAPNRSVNNLSSLQISDSSQPSSSKETEEIEETENEHPTEQTETPSSSESSRESDTQTDSSDESEKQTDKQTSNSETSDESKPESSTSGASSDQEYTLAPDFTVTDAEGNEITLLSLLGKPAVLNFWNSNCPPCKMEMPDFEEMYAELGDDVQFIMIDTVGAMGETKESGQDYVKEQKFTFPVYFDTSQDAIYTYGITAFPTTYFIDKDGYLIAGARGMIDKETLQMGIDMILK